MNCDYISSNSKIDSGYLTLSQFQSETRKFVLFTQTLIINNRVIPLISCIQLSVYALLIDAGEKITLSMLNSLAINVFLLLVFKLLPPTSSSIPLISRYTLFTFLTNMARTFNTPRLRPCEFEFTCSMNKMNEFVRGLNSKSDMLKQSCVRRQLSVVSVCIMQASTAITVVILHVAHRSPRTHRLPPYARRLFARLLAAPLLMRPPPSFEFDELAPRRLSPPDASIQMLIARVIRSWTSTASQNGSRQIVASRHCARVWHPTEPSPAAHQPEQRQRLRAAAQEFSAPPDSSYRNRVNRVGDQVQKTRPAFPSYEQSGPLTDQLEAEPILRSPPTGLSAVEQNANTNKSKGADREDGMLSLVNLYSSLPRALESPRMAFLASRPQKAGAELCMRSDLNQRQQQKRSQCRDSQASAHNGGRQILDSAPGGDSSPLADDPVIRSRLGPTALAALFQSQSLGQSLAYSDASPRQPAPGTRHSQLAFATPEGENIQEKPDQKNTRRSRKQQELSVPMLDTLRALSYLANLRRSREIEQMVCNVLVLFSVSLSLWNMDIWPTTSSRAGTSGVEVCGRGS